MKERSIAKKITQHLNYGTTQLDRSVLTRLQSARQLALEAQARPHRVWGLAWAGAGTGSHGEGRHTSLRFWISLAVLLAGMLIALNWQVLNGDDPTGDDVDATLLAGDLPVRAYLDNDFDSWLKQSSRR